MKKYLALVSLVGVLCGVSLSSFQKTPVVPPGEFLVHGELANVPDGVELTLCTLAGNMFVPVCKDTLRKGAFLFRDTISSVRKMLILCGDKGFPGTSLNVWIAPGKLVEISGKDKLLKTWSVKSDVPEQVEENRFAACVASQQRKLMEYLVVEYDWQRDMFNAENINNERFGKMAWTKIDSIRKLRDPLDKEIYKKELEYMKTAPISRVWIDRMAQYASLIRYKDVMPYAAEVKELYNRMPEKETLTPVGQEITQYIFPPVLVNKGDMMVDGDLYDTRGALRHLSEFKGNYILLDFWSSGCGPCIQSIPELEKITDMYKDKMVVVSVSEDPEKPWKECLASRKMKGNQWNELRRGRTGLSASYQVKGIPHYVLIAPDGKVQDVWGGYGPESLLRKMEENLK